MKNPFASTSTFLKNFSTASIGTLLVVLILSALGGFGWMMISEKEDYLVQRNFRLLKLWSQDISSKIASYQQVFQFSAKGILKSFHPDTKFSVPSGQDNNNYYLRKFVPPATARHEHPNHKKILETLSPWSCSQDQSETAPSTPTDTEDIHIQNIAQQLAGICQAEGLTTLTLKLPISLPNKWEPFQLAVNHNQDPPVLLLTYSTTMLLHDQTEHIQIIGEIQLVDFLQRLTDEPIFDEVFLFDSSGKEGEDEPLIFHSGSQEFSWANFQEILDRLTPETSILDTTLGQLFKESGQQKVSPLPNSPHQFSIKVPGRIFNAFTLPVNVPQSTASTWKLVGMIDHHTFQNSYLAISSTFLLAVMFLILGLVLVIPLIHLKTMGATDPLRVTNVLTVVLAAFLGTGLLMFVVLDLAVYGEEVSTLRHKMATSAQAIKDHVHQEIRLVLSTLKRFDESAFFEDDLAEITDEQKGLNVGERSVMLEVLDIRDNPEHSMKQLCGTKREPGTQPCYSDFLTAFWMDQDGSLRINWAREPALGVTTNLSLQGRDYVKRVLKEPDKLWRMSDTTKSDNFNFFLEPIISWNTGKNTVVASMPSHATTHTHAPWVSAIEFEFLSLMDNVVLPPGIGFAVIDPNTHKVLFHSIEERNLREDFLVETDQNDKLQDLFAANTDGYSEGSYWGKSTSFFTLPLHPLPWTLVVYRDKEVLRSLNLFGLLVAGTFYVLWSVVVYLIAWFVLIKGSGDRQAPWMWPHVSYHYHYVALTKSNWILFFLGLTSIWFFSGQPGWQLFIGLILVPASCLILAFLLIKKTPSQAKTSLSTFPNSYAFVATSFLLTFAAIPAFGSFSSVFHKEMTLFTKYQLSEIFQRFEESGKRPIADTHREELPAPSLKTIGLPADCDAPTPPATNHASFGLYPDFILSTSLTLCDRKRAQPPQERTRFDWLFSTAGQLFLPLLKQVSLRAVMGDYGHALSASDSTNHTSINWEMGKNDVTLFSKEHPIQFRAIRPLQLWFLDNSFTAFQSLTVGKAMLYLLLTGITLSWLIFIPKFIAIRTVFLYYPTPFRFPQDILFTRTKERSATSNRLILGFPGQGKTPMAYQYDHDIKAHTQAASSSTHSLYIDLKVIPPDRWNEVLSLKISSLNLQDHDALHVTIDHLEWQWKDPKVNRQKLELLGRIQTRSYHQTIPSKTASSPQPESSQAGQIGDLIIQVLTKILSSKQR